jgi:hypothetical protein
MLRHTARARTVLLCMLATSSKSQRSISLNAPEWEPPN